MSRVFNPLEIKKEELPVFMLVDDRRGWFGFLIKQHSKGNYNHIAELFMPGFLASQDMVGYRMVSVSKYLKRRYMLKFWAYRGKRQAELVDCIKSDLKSSVRQRRYDFLGILGQLLHLKWLNNPKTYFCSERASKHLRSIGMKLPKHPAPSELNQLFKTKTSMKCLGYWVKD